MTAGRPSIHLDEPTFWMRFGLIEHEALEFKTSPNHLREVIPAMAMTAGGQIVLGVTDERCIVGCPLDQRALDTIMRRAQEAGVDVELEVLFVAGLPLTLITVPHVTDRIVTTTDGRLLRRIGSDNVPMRGEQLARFVRRHLYLRLPLVRRVAALGAR
jgi:ATP-dependent DNA helicase RecG